MHAGLAHNHDNCNILKVVKTPGNSHKDTMVNRLIAAATFGVYCAIACVCSLASTDAGTHPTTAPSNKPLVADIPTGLWTFESYGSFASQPSGTREQLYSGTIGVGYYFKPNNSLTLEITGLQGTQAGPDVASGGCDLLLRTHLINELKWTAFIDFGAGMLESDNRLPASGTDFNLSFKTGAGAAVHLSGNTDFLFGTRYLHISNARIDGAARNPSINTIEGYMGLLFKL